MNNFQGLGISALQVGLDSMMIKPRRGIFGPGSSFPLITIPKATLEEKSTDEMEITEHPLQQGASIADHAFKRAAEVVIHCAWSNSVAGNLLPNIVPGPPMDLSAIYGNLLFLQESRTLFDLYTGKRKYTNMLLRVITVENDFKTENALFATLQCKQIIIVNSQAVTLDSTKMSAPQATTSPVPQGGKSLSPSVASFVQPGY